MRFLASAGIFLLSGIVFGQTALAQEAGPAPSFDAADVHASPKRSNTGTSGAVIRTSGRYEFTNATMVDLIRTAYNVDADKVLGGPSWLELDRFDIFAKVPPKTPEDTARAMLQGLLADRFKLTLHKDLHPLPTYALSVSKAGHKLKEADGSGEPGCKMTIQQNTPAEAAALQSAIQNGGAANSRIATFLYSCHGMTMTAFAEQMRTMIVAQSYIGNNPTADQTGLKGAWDFDFKYTVKQPPNPNQTINTPNGPVQLTMIGEYITLQDAMEKQLGLKLDPATLPVPVYTVDSVNRTPTPNPAGVVSQLPPAPSGEFEVAEIRLTPPGATSAGSRGFQRNGELQLNAYPLKSLISLGWDLPAPDALVDAPKWLDNAKVDLIAKLTPAGGPNQGVDIDALRPAIRALLMDRFKLKIHTETRPGTGWTLTAGKPKMAKADPANRSICKEGPGKDGKDPRTANPVVGRLLTCQNVTMAQFAEELKRISGGYFRSDEVITDSTGLTDAYDFTLSFSGAQYFPETMLGKAMASGNVTFFNGAPTGGNANDPTGAVPLWDAVNKQLGIKMEQQKRDVQVFVLDHIEDKPTE